MRKVYKVIYFVVFIAFCSFNLASPSWAAPNFKLDGRFEDWRGRASLADGQGDGRQGEDFKTIFWGTNENEQRLYFMIEIYEPANPRDGMTCRLYVDVNGNGGYEDSTDKFAELVYNPEGEEAGEVLIKLYTVSGDFLAEYGGNWGEGAGDGGRRFEFYIPMAEMDIYPAQPIRFYLSGIGGAGVDRLPDRGDNQWMPFPVVVKDTVMIAVASVFWLAGAVFLRRHRIWLFYYVWGAVGFTFLFILLLRGSFAEYQMEQQVGMILHNILGYFDIKTFVFDRAPGTLLVLIEVENSWTTIDIDIESSGLLEACIYLGLLLFYPPYPPGKKALFALFGIVSIYAINILRLLVIITAIHWGGRDMIFIAHTVLGRLVFFFLIIALYWQVFTRPSLMKAREHMENA
ncbi:MAG: exosortase family protein XrtG [Firmicutes bacterium]|nr:exosortase family protein XrtG [Bacillota bacterium]